MKKKYTKKLYYHESYQLDPIAEENIYLLKNWGYIIINFLKDKKIAEFSILGNYLFFEYALAFLTKCENPELIMKNSKFHPTQIA